MSAVSQFNNLRFVDLQKFVSRREGETKLGQAMQVIEGKQPLASELEQAVKQGANYALIGIPEDIGPRANNGRGGAEGAWPAFLSSFANIQANRFLDPAKIVLVGEVETSDLMEKVKDAERDTTGGVKRLRDACAELDQRVAPIIKETVLAGLQPLVIGGGNNNSYPIIKGTAEALRQKSGKDTSLAVINCDAHADFRILEGRHSGNPFSYAHKEGYLKGYFVFALFESYNSEEMLERLSQSGFGYASFDNMAMRNTRTVAEALENAISYLLKCGLPMAFEFDVDTITGMPSSAETPYGISAELALQIVHHLASKIDSQYFHLSEGAPKWNANGDRIVGKTLSALAIAYMKGREASRS